MLFSKPDNVASTLTRKQQKRQRKPRFGSDWVSGFILKNFLKRPSMETF